ncbi:MAG: helix-turn-helix domain-containing protein [Mycobacterium sp.]
MAVPAGVLLSPAEAAVVASAIGRLDADLQPNERGVLLNLRRAMAKSGVSPRTSASAPNGQLPARRIADARSDTRNRRSQSISAHHCGHATLNSGEAAAVLGITPNAVRDLRRRGRLDAERIAGRWQFDATQIHARAKE